MLNKKQVILALSVVVVLVVLVAIASSNLKKSDKSQNSNQASQEISEQGYVPKVDGLKIDVLKEGSEGKVSKSGDLLSVHYVGKLQDGTVFDSSIDRGQPFSFTVGAGEVIQGWDKGLLGMKIGEKRKLTMISELGYGNQAVGSKIPANSTLVFEVELMKIN